MATGRPITLAFELFKATTNATTKRMVYTEKADGFHIISLGDGVYTTKNGLPLMGRNLQAIEAYLLAWKHDDGSYFVDPSHVEIKMGGRKTKKAFVIHFEFVALLDGKESLDHLFRGQCVDPVTGLLNTKDYTYVIRVFDAQFYNTTLHYDYTYHAIFEAYGHEHTVVRLWGDSDLRSSLNSAEGIVVYGWLDKTQNHEVLKVKVPIPVKLYLIGVRCTIPDFEGWDKLLFCTEEYTAIYEISYTDIFTDYTRAKQGKAFVNQKSVKSDANGIVHCVSKSVLEPILDALFVEISKRVKFTPIGTTKTEARIRTTDGVKVIRCAINRSFKLEADTLYVKDPIPVVFGANDIWRMPEIHLQAAGILAVGEYDPGDLLAMPMTSEHLLNTVPTRDRIAAYKMLGLSRNPMDGLATMDMRMFAPMFDGRRVRF